MGLFSNLLAAGGRALNKNLVEAMGAGGVHIANADGRIDRDEVAGIIDAMMNVEQVKASFTVGELRLPIEKFITIAKNQPTQARMSFMKECSDVARDHDNALIVAAACYDVANRGGGVSPEEKEAFIDVCEWLGVKPSELGLRGF